MIIALDTETTGLDGFHGAKVFFLTTCDEKGKQVFYEWAVNPLTRQPTIPQEDIEEIRDVIKNADRIVLQNGKFDVGMLSITNPEFLRYWDWDKVEDTLIAGHLLASNQPHNLTDMALHYLGIDISRYEEVLKEAVVKARNHCKRRFPDWRLAKGGLPEMPSAKGGDKKKTKRGIESGNPWKFDMWVPLALCNAIGPKTYSLEHPWRTVLRDYSNADSATTLQLWIGVGKMKGMESLLKEKGLWKIYRERMKLPRIVGLIERNGITLSGECLTQLETDCKTESRRCANVMQNIADSLDYDLHLPRGTGPNDSLRQFFFGPSGLCIEPIRSSNKKKKTDTPSLDKDVLARLETGLPPNTKARLFVQTLVKKRKVDTSLSFYTSYRRFMRQVASLQGTPFTDWFILHPFLNQTGSDTLRFTCSNPNGQQISKEEIKDIDGEILTHSARYAFGPIPGRELWSCDFQNVELRVPAFKAPEPLLVEVFLNPDKSPYFGSYHLVVFDILHPEKFAKHGKECKDIFAASWYQWIKNGNFAVVYGAGEETADRTYRVPGAFKLIQKKFPNLARMNQETVRFADKHGYVETFPDASVDITRGYPLWIQRTQWGSVEPTKPFNYKIQGTAMWLTARAMVRCQEQLDEWKRIDGFTGYITLQVHDEIVFDFPKTKLSPKDDPGNLQPHMSSNLWRIRILQKLMAQGGQDIGVPTPVAAKWHEGNWEKGVTL